MVAIATVGLKALRSKQAKKIGKFLGNKALNLGKKSKLGFISKSSAFLQRKLNKNIGEQTNSTPQAMGILPKDAPALDWDKVKDKAGEVLGDITKESRTAEAGKSWFMLVGLAALAFLAIRK